MSVHSITVTNVNQALSEALWWLHTAGVDEDSRNGPVRVAPGPVAVTYKYPKERVLFAHDRDANPFFHLMESLWMLAGRNDVAFCVKFVKRMAEFSDDGKTFHAPYGYRWRKHFDRDQLTLIADELTRNPNSRRAVLTMWDPREDLAKAGKDFPCNTQVYFDRRGGKLNMTVCNRSNDAIWGAFGANAVHMSVMQEYLAALIGVEVGTYTQFANNLHAYKSIPNYEQLVPHVEVRDYYKGVRGFGVEPFPLVDDPNTWDIDLAAFFATIDGSPEGIIPEFPAFKNNRFFAQVAAPMYKAWISHKSGHKKLAMDYAEQIQAQDWQVACTEWLIRRANKAELQEKGYLENRTKTLPKATEAIEPELPKALELIRSGGKVRRFHSIPVVNGETVASHSYGVAWLCWLLMQGNPSAELLMNAVGHDTAEAAVGDIPAPTKRALGIREAASKIEDAALEEAGIVLPKLSAQDERTLKLADAMDGMLFCADERKLGHRGIGIVYSRFESYVMELKPTDVELCVLKAIQDRWLNSAFDYNAPKAPSPAPTKGDAK